MCVCHWLLSCTGHIGLWYRSCHWAHWGYALAHWPEYELGWPPEWRWIVGCKLTRSSRECGAAAEPCKQGGVAAIAFSYAGNCTVHTSKDC